jgi:hypothetical protein
MTQVAVALVSLVGALAGVALGAVLTGRFHHAARLRQEVERARLERRQAFAAFFAAAREWRAAVQSAEAPIVAAGPVFSGRHASSGPVEVGALRRRDELR